MPTEYTDEVENSSYTWRAFSDICQLVWLTKNTSYENVGGIFFTKKYNRFLKRKIFDWQNHNKFVLEF